MHRILDSLEGRLRILGDRGEKNENGNCLGLVGK